MKKTVRKPFGRTKEEVHERVLHGKNDVWAVGHGIDLDDVIDEIQERLKAYRYCQGIKVDYLNGEYVVVAHYL